MAEDKSKRVVVKARAKAFLTSKSEEAVSLTERSMPKKTTAKPQRTAPKASEIAAAIRKGEIASSETGKNAAASKKPADAFAMNQVPMLNRRNRLTENGRVKKIPACKMAEPMKKPAEDVLMIAGKVTAANKKIQTPAAAPVKKVEAVKKAEPVQKPVEPKKEEVKTVPVKKAEPKKAAAPVKKAEPKKAAAPVKKVEPKKVAAPVKKAEPKKAAAPVKKAEPKKAAAPAAAVMNTYIEYQNNSYDQAKLVASAEKIWTKNMKKKADALKSLKLYVKPQEKMVYCVFNEKETASFTI